MPIVFLQQKQTQKKLTVVFVLVLLSIVFVVWQGFSKETKSSQAGTIFLPHPEIKINYENLKAPILEQLIEFSEIRPFSGEIGRDNPFMSY